MFVEPPESLQGAWVKSLLVAGLEKVVASGCPSDSVACGCLLDVVQSVLSCAVLSSDVLPNSVLSYAAPTWYVVSFFSKMSFSNSMSFSYSDSVCFCCVHLSLLSLCLSVVLLFCKRSDSNFHFFPRPYFALLLTVHRHKGLHFTCSPTSRAHCTPLFPPHVYHRQWTGQSPEARTSRTTIGPTTE